MFATAGSRLGAGALSQKYIGSGPITRVTKNAAQSVPNNVFWTYVTFDTVVIDDVGAWRPKANVGTPNVSMFAPPGFNWCQLTAYLAWDNNSTNGRDMGIQWTASTPIGGNANMGRPLYSEVDQGLNLNEGGTILCMPWFRCSARDEFYIGVAQNSGGALNIYPTDLFGVPLWFQAEWGN